MGDPRRTWAVNRFHDFKNRPCWRRPGPQWPAYASPEWGRGGTNALEAYSNGQLSCKAPSSATTSPGCASSHSILSSHPSSWPPVFLLKNHLMALECFQFAFLLLAALKILFIFNFCHFNSYVSLYGLPWAHLVQGSLCFLDLHVFFILQVREVFS